MLDDQQLTTVSKLDFVKKITKVKTNLVLLRSAHESSFAWPLALEQMHAEALLQNGLTGKGVAIGIIDGRFKNVNTHPGLKRLVEGKSIVETRNFVDVTTPEFLTQEQNSQERHCPEVLKIIGGISDKDGSPLGLAPNASFYLARTEWAEREFKGEEDYWIAALEWMDSLGVRLVNSSIGYTAYFDDPADNHKISDIDGKTTAISQAAQVAAKEKGMILVVAAGNDGDNEFWKVLSVPADARNVITVGATDDKRLKQSYSSIGPSTLPYLKPDISVFSERGTSFAAPVITGMIACMLEKVPTLKSSQVLEIVQKSGHLYPYGNNFVGRGVPDANKILTLLESNTNQSTAKEKKVKSGTYKYRLPAGTTEAVVFHKTDNLTVVYQEVLKANKRNKIILTRQDSVAYSTLVVSGKVLEINWE